MQRSRWGWGYANQLDTLQGTVKRAASEALRHWGGTITHHHAVGRMHKPWYAQESPPLFTQSLRAVKATLDPQGILNPGVLFD